jgi:hypothetical protein
MQINMAVAERELAGDDDLIVACDRDGDVRKYR